MSSDADQPGPEQQAAREAAIACFAAQRSGRPVAVPDAPGAQAELARVEAMWAALEGLAGDDRVARMRAEALARLDAPAPRRRGVWLAGGLAASVALVAGLAGGLVWQRGGVSGGGAVKSAQAFALREVDNGTAPPRHLALGDGTDVTLDAQTRLHVGTGTGAGARRVVLDAGRAYFRVKHDAAHPFQVQVGDVVITDVGTRFAVGVEGGVTTITLVEGAVDVVAGQALTQRLAPGMQLRLQRGQASLARVDTGRATGWQGGMISADDEPLNSLLARFNLYLACPLVLRSPQAGQIRVSGEFRLDDPQGFLRALAAMGHADAVARAADTGAPP